MLRNSEFRLLTLGRVALLDPAGDEEASLAKRRRKVVLLAVLARSRRAMSRDALAEMFWGDQPEDRARHSLSDALSHLRRVLGKDALNARQDAIILAPDFPLAIDATEFEAAARRGDHTAAVALYHGPFLDGFHVDDSATFDTWVSAERGRLGALFLKSIEQATLAARAAGDPARATELAERWLESDPLSEQAAGEWLQGILAPGTAESDRAAVAAYERLTHRLKKEYDLAPAEPVARLVREAAARIKARGSIEPDSAQLAGDADSPVSVPQSARDTPRDPHPSTTRPRHGLRLALAATSLALIGTAGWLAFHRSATPPRGRPSIAITAIRNVSGDSTAQWLADGLPQMIASDLSRSSEIDVIAPERLRDILAREGKRSERDLDPAQLLDLAHRAGATELITGGLVRGDTALVLDLTIHDVASGAVTRIYTVVNSNALELADLAAARLLDAANLQTPGMHLAELETSSLEAYQHFVRAYQVGIEGRLAERRRELDEAVALDSGFISAVRDRQGLAWVEGDGATVARLTAVFNRYRARASEWDRLNQDVETAYHTGERERSEALGEALIERYPSDPRGYMLLDQIYLAHGRFDLAEGVLARALALDSLALEAGHGPCAPCVSLSGLADIRAVRGDLAGAEQAARRWIALQPDLPGPWAELSTVLSFAGRFDEAIDAARRSATLSGGDVVYVERIGRALLMARRYASVDSLVHVWSTDARPPIRVVGFDLKAMLERERGQYRASSATIERLIALDPPSTSLRLEEANSLGRIGDFAGVRRAFANVDHWPGAPADDGLMGDQARAFCWHHALEGAALAGLGDTILLNAMADSIRSVAGHSYYGRDWRLHHHLLGLVAMKGGRFAEAAAQFDSARWTATGWTETNAELARADLALGHTDAALLALREAYQAPLDAMGRYEPRTDLDFLMARAFEQAGNQDSARVYITRVEEAWRRADPEIRRRLLELGRGHGV